MTGWIKRDQDSILERTLFYSAMILIILGVLALNIAVIRVFILVLTDGGAENWDKAQFLFMTILVGAPLIVGEVAALWYIKSKL